MMFKSTIQVLHMETNRDYRPKQYALRKCEVVTIHNHRVHLVSRLCPMDKLLLLTVSQERN